MRPFPIGLIGGLLVPGVSALAGTALVLNPSFESNLNTTTDPLTPGAPQGWPYYSAIDDWTSGGGGVNDVTYDPGGPFHNAGTAVPDGRRIGFKQGGGAVSQDLTGLIPGKQYWIQFRYDARNGSDLDLAVQFSTINQGGAMDAVLDTIFKPRPAIATQAPYYSRTVPFTPDLESGTLSFVVTARGDSTILLDAVTIVQRDEGNFPLMNGSFEASGVVYDGATSAGTDWPGISGWVKTGVAGVDDGSGGQADNGEVPEQALVVFISGEGSLAQTLAPLVKGETYQVQFAYNAKSGAAAHLQVKVGDTVIWEQDVTAVGGASAYRTASASFTAASDTAVLTFASTAAAGTVLLDNVKVLGKVGSTLPPLALAPAKLLLRVGEQATASVTVPNERLAQGPAVIKLRSANTNVFVLPDADATGELSLQFGFPTTAVEPPTGAKMWLKADAISGVANGAKLATWPDASGNANNATQPAEVNQPTYVANGRNGLPTVKFEDGDADNVPVGVQFMDGATAVQTKTGASFTAMIVFKSDDTGITASALEGRDNLLQPLDVDASNLGRTVLFLDTPSGTRKLQSVSAQASLAAESVYAPGNWAMATVLQDASAAALSLFINSVPEKTVPMGAEGGQNGPWRIGATKQGHGGLKGEIAEVLVYDRALTPAERQQAESYLAKKWNLPAASTQTYAIRAASIGNAAITITDSAGLLLPADITTVYVAGSTFVFNPSFELDKDSGTATAPVTGWSTGGANIGMAEIGNAFLAPDDLGIPDRRKVLRIQGSGTVAQTVRGLEPGKTYGVQFFYNRRSFGYDPGAGPTMSLQVTFAGQELVNLQDLVPASFNALTEYYFAEVPLTPAAAEGVLQFKTTVASGVDATLFLDAVSIVPRLAGEIAIKNSSFEGSAMGANWPGYLQPDRVGGWLAAGGGYGVNAYSPKTFFVEPFLDNGINSDQDNAFFGQGGVSIIQTVTGLTGGANYTLVLDYNSRDGRGQNSTAAPNLGQMEVSLDSSPILTTEEFPPVDTISPWPGFRHTLPFYQAFVPFTASAETTELKIAHVGVVGDETLCVDNVRIVPGTRTPPAITKELEAQTVAAGGNATFTVTASGSNLGYRWYQDGVLLKNGSGISGANTATLTLTGVQAAQAGTYSVLVTDGLGLVGSAAALTVEASAEVSLSVALLANGNVRVSWPASATGFVLQSTLALPGGWSPATEPAVVEGDQNVVTVQAAGAARFFRLSRP